MSKGIRYDRPSLAIKGKVIESKYRDSRNALSIAKLRKAETWQDIIGHDIIAEVKRTRKGGTF
jgi:hypothetical protein